MSDRALSWWVRAALTVPFLVALAALATTHWSPVLDLAMTELRVRDVLGRHSPLIGLPGRIGTFPDQGSHPGPLSFYLLAPVYRLLGSTAFALLVSATAVNVAASWAAVALAARRGGQRLVVGVGAIVMVSCAWFGASVLTQPWNPYLPLLSFIVVLLATWGVLEGDHVLLVPLVGFASLCAQTHVPYLSLSVALCALAFGVVAARWWRARVIDPSQRRSLLLALVFGALLWFPVLVDEFRHSPGNVTMLRRHFLSPPEEPIGITVGAKTLLAHFDVTHIVTATISRSDYFIDRLDALASGRWVIGIVVVLIWIAGATVATRVTERRIIRLHVVVAVASVVALLSTGRIFGKIWYYLTLWAWPLALVAVAATAWSFIALCEQAWRRRLPVTQVSVLVLVLAGAMFVKDAATVDPPEDRLSRVLNAVVGPTAAALDEGVGAADGKGGTYAVVWDDAYYFGSQGYGLINELERRGFRARSYETYRVPVTAHRVTTVQQATAEVVLVTGVNVADWRNRANVEEVAYFEPRSAVELAEFDQLRAEALTLLHAADLEDLVGLVDNNLFGASVDARLPPGVEPLLARMLVLGEQTAVFVAPAGTF
ncbi:MAG: hypothetical protein HY826_11040 [Actinobacteria bacterium]|nr:hypothetical protein [Actinomycetota bacterium]